jgi:YD repeat-containing protein
VSQFALPAKLFLRWVLFGNPVLVTHETHTRVGWEWIGFARSALVTRTKKGEWQSPLQYSEKTDSLDVMSRGPCQMNPYGSMRGSEPAAASRDAGLDFPGPR